MALATCLVWWGCGMVMALMISSSRVFSNTLAERLMWSSAVRMVD
jgi:uncharacterized protein YceK